jgi:hypothetical protein
MEDKMASMQRKINPIRLLKWQRFQFFLIALILLIGFNFLFENNCYSQFGLSGYPLVNLSQGNSRWGGAMGMGQRKKSGEYWLNIEISVLTKKTTISPAYEYFPPTQIKATNTDVAVVFLYHKDVINRGNLGKGVAVFWELGGGLDFESIKTEADFFSDIGSDENETKTSLIMQLGAGLDINRKIRIRCTPFVKMGSDAVTGLQFSAFVLFGLNQQVKEEVER